MSNTGREGEQLFAQLMIKRGNEVRDVSKDEYYFDKDIDFFLVSASGEVCSVEVKWCYGISKYNNLFLEFINPRSQQWNGEGWWPHCKADFLAYGDAVNRKFYVFHMETLREAVEPLWESLPVRSTWDGSIGKALPLHKVKDLATEICES